MDLRALKLFQSAVRSCPSGLHSGMLKFRSLRLVIVGAIFIAFTTTAPPATAARLVPSGAAIVAITGGEAVISKVKPGKYRIVFPASQTIKWLGEVRGQSGAHIGSFSEKELVSRWAGMRNGSKEAAQATLSWKGRDRWVSSKISSPRINKRGLLVVDLATTEALPRRIKDFNLSIDRALRAKDLRFNTSTQTFTLDDTMSFEIAINGNASTVTTAVSEGTDCFGGVPLDGDGHIADIPGVYCGDFSILPMSTIQVIEASPTAQGWEQMVLFVLAQNTNDIEIFAIIANWDYQAS